MLKKTACEYFLLLSKLEYALKNADFVKGNDRDNAQPDWDKFFNDVQSKIKLDIESDDIQEFLNHPPARQLFKGGILSWSKPQKILCSDSRRVLDTCLTIRNNLFHGGKYGDGNAGRNEVLLSAATKILTSAMNVHPQVKQNFDLADL